MVPIDPRVVTPLRGILEPLLAVAAVYVLTSLLIAPLTPITQRVRVELRPLPGAEAPATHEELLERVEALELAGGAEVLLLDGASRLVLRGVSDPAAIEEPVGRVLAESGYRRADFVAVHEVDVDRLLRSQSYTFPWLLSIHAAVFLACGLLLARGRIRPRPPETIASVPRSVALGLLAGIGAVLLSAAISALLTLVGLPVEEQAWVQDLLGDPSALARMIPWVVLIGPVAEEVFFRGYFFRFTTQRAGLPMGLLLSSVVFSAVHGNASGFLVYLWIGCVFAWVYHRTGRIVAPIFGHITLNAVVVAVSSWAIEAKEVIG